MDRNCAFICTVSVEPPFYWSRMESEDEDGAAVVVEVIVHFVVEVEVEEYRSGLYRR